MEIRTRFLETIEKHDLIKKGENIVVGVSGGPDSICLLHLLWSIREEYSLGIYVVHLDHRYRGKESQADAEYVREFCRKLNIESHIFSINVNEYKAEKGITFEEAGRELRYKLFYEIAQRTESTKIAVAQNSNDQAETVLMRMMRGSGLEGLTAIDYIRDNMIIRPLLDINRREIENYCTEFSLNPRIDKTNLEAIYTRNKIRLELIPYIQKNFNPNIIETLCRGANILRQDNEYLEEATKKALENIEIEGSKSKVRIDLKKYNELHLALKKRIIRVAIEKIKGDLKNITLTHIDNAIAIIKEEKVGTKINLPAQILIELGYNSIDIKLFKGNTNSIKEFQYQVPIEGSVYVEELGLSLSTEIVALDTRTYKRNNTTVFIDKNKIKGELIIRNRRNGDRFMPLGMKGNKKIKDYFIDEKIPKDKRDKIPLICDQKEIIWVGGYRLSEKYKIDEKTTIALKLNLEEGCV